MPVYKIHRIKEPACANFRWASHTGGAASAKPRDYEPGAEVEARSSYAAWALLRDTESALRVGDILEDEAGSLRIFKYVGFEEAKWMMPEMRQGIESMPPAAGEVLLTPA
jgi:hypothetical protein